MLRLKGRNVEENQFVKVSSGSCSLRNLKLTLDLAGSFQMGAYHTIDLELNRKFEIAKPEWDSISLGRVDTACDVTQNADVAAVIMQEGIAHICLITSNMTIVRSKIDMSIPRKRKNFTSQHEKVK